MTVSCARHIIEAETPKRVLRQIGASKRNKFTEQELEQFYNAYAEMALWSSRDDRYEDGDETLEGEDLAEETKKKMLADCRDFLSQTFDIVWGNLGMAGGDFWLTRCGHGAGFWDGDWDKGRELTDIAQVYGNVDLYVGDDGLVYQS